LRSLRRIPRSAALCLRGGAGERARCLMRPCPARACGKAPWARAGLFVCSALLLGACAASGRHEGRVGAPFQLPRRWHYDVVFDAELTQVDATVCFEGAVPAELRAGID